MSLEKIVALIAHDKPSLSILAQTVLLVESLNIEDLYSALITPPSNKIFITLLSGVLREKIVAQNIGLATNSIVNKLQNNISQPLQA